MLSVTALKDVYFAIKYCIIFNYCSVLFPSEEELLLFDLQSLATLATARTLELGSQESSRVGSERHFPARRILNLRRKCSWTPRNEPVRLDLFCSHMMLEESNNPLFKLLDQMPCKGQVCPNILLIFFSY